ncbi:nuclear transport factor 2 family protein [Pelagibacteraceae bacterium]|nr:nuclear transport factor 2 family protein [Pelagibacteraceae bacterium]|tara:strand:+ start:169 stop:564 length:396 start_codon:yes stop_codon:yes gene_type:complete
MQNPISKWHDVVSLRDYNMLTEIVDDNCIFYSPVVFTPQRGKDITLKYLMAASEVFNASNFKYHKEIISNQHASLEFTLTLEDTEINGIDLITWNDDGLITEFKVFIRPLQGVNIIHKMMGNMLESFKNVS